MRITVSIDDQMIEDLRSFTNINSKSGAVNAALTDWLSWKKRQRIKDYRGKLKLDCQIETGNQLDLTELERLADGSD